MAKKVSKLKSEAETPVDTAMSMKMTSTFRDWLNEVAEFDRSTAVQVMEKGAVDYAKKIGFPKPAPKRTGGR